MISEVPCWPSVPSRARFRRVVSTAVIIPDFAAGNRISDSEIEALLLRAEKNVGQFDYEDKAVHGAIWEGTPQTAR